MSVHLTHNSDHKSRRVSLRLVNDVHYRYGFDEGIAVVFDDDYRIVSAGLHKRAKLKSLGIKFNVSNFIEEGDFGGNSQIYAFDSKQRPNVKIGKLYTNYLLKGLDFVNSFVNNPSK